MVCDDVDDMLDGFGHGLYYSSHDVHDSDRRPVQVRPEPYLCTLLREPYRAGSVVKNRTIANLSHCMPEEIAALRLALEHKANLAELGSIEESIRLQEGPSVGAVWTAYTVAKRLGIEKAPGTESAGKLALWQVIARTIDQGSRLSAVRLAQTHAACDVLGMSRGFDENDLYDNLGGSS